MPVYTTDAKLVALLPESLPTDVGTALKRAPYIAEGSAWVDGQLVGALGLGEYGGATQVFGDVTDTDSPTPAVIQMIATYAAAALVADSMGMRHNWDPKEAQSLWRRAREMTSEIREGQTLVIELGAVRRLASIGSNLTGSVPVFRRARRDADGDKVTDSGSMDELVN